MECYRLTAPRPWCLLAANWTERQSVLRFTAKIENQ
jgi:hypothetical protein